ncbi:hypothetical protein [Fibrella forsythiae]|uniref:DUF3868 domain-containing protein n=1 Tax=Fibrella forsythiae TaxID=2817061 RepID=A0ABS3JB20_9BACT|nr:hypothetical protein [Fibrella forsythiae]MBO0947185.1 hypothetical protein [Fibrella forsythiae]
MKSILSLISYPILLVLTFASLNAAGQTDSLASTKQKKLKTKKAPEVKPLFTTDDVLSLTITARMQPILRDRIPPKADEKGLKHPAMLTVAADSGGTVQLPINLQVRGHFRRSSANCTFPPLYLTVPKQPAKGTPFAKQSALKLVTHCNNEAYVVNEYLVYKLYNLFTDLSFKARLAQVTYADSAKKQAIYSRWGILLEDDSDVARRNRSKVYKSRYRAENCDTLATATMAIFEYMIGNTDWSVVYQHNVRLVTDSTKARPLPIPYDFDHSGIVAAPYAKPAEQLNISSVQERLYRGPIYPQSVLRQVIARFNTLKPQIYAIYTNEKRVERGYVKQTLAYLDDFFALINDPQKARTVFQDPNGRGVQIKGLGN